MEFKPSEVKLTEEQLHLWMSEPKQGYMILVTDRAGAKHDEYVAAVRLFEASANIFI